MILHRTNLMRVLCCLALLTLAVSFKVLGHPQASMDITAYCKYFGYPLERHQVTTQDGYILTMFRIQRKGTSIRDGLKPIVLMHGLTDSSDTWLLNEEGKAPGFMLANRGYDVWLGNSRGNKHSRNHTKYNPDKDKEFWYFSFQHMADFDLPAVFTHVNKVTGQKMHYIGHSQGTMQMHVALSKNNPVVESLIDKYFGFGPVARVKYARSNLLDLMDYSGLIEWYYFHGINQFLPSMKWFQSDLGIIFCKEFSKVCTDFIGQICDGDPSLDNYERSDVFVGHEPSGTSLMNMEHWKQLYDWGNFQAYNYGTDEKNKAHYGQPTPPFWDLKNVKVPIRLIAGSSDLLADPTDVEWLWANLSPEAKKFKKTYTSGHVTFLWGLEVSPWMNDVFTMLEE